MTDEMEDWLTASMNGLNQWEGRQRGMREIKCFCKIEPHPNRIRQEDTVSPCRDCIALCFTRLIIGTPSEERLMAIVAQEPHLVSYFLLGDFPVAIWMTRYGSLCGYLGVPPSHPWYGQNCADIEVSVHGGLTYGEHEIYGHPAAIKILEERDKRWRDLPDLITKPNLMWERELKQEKELAGKSREYPYKTGLDIWWFGFDCAHAGDKVPGLPSFDGVYRDENYVRKELLRLASQAAVVAEVNQIAEQIL